MRLVKLAVEVVVDHVGVERFERLDPAEACKVVVQHGAFGCGAALQGEPFELHPQQRCRSEVEIGWARSGAVGASLHDSFAMEALLNVC